MASSANVSSKVLLKILECKYTLELTKGSMFSGELSRSDFGRVELEQLGSIASENLLQVVGGYPQAVKRFEHERDAADLVRVIAASENVIRAGEIYGQLQRQRIEIHRVVVELLKVF